MTPEEKAQLQVNSENRIKTEVLIDQLLLSVNEIKVTLSTQNTISAENHNTLILKVDNIERHVRDQIDAMYEKIRLEFETKEASNNVKKDVKFITWGMTLFTGVLIILFGSEISRNFLNLF